MIIKKAEILAKGVAQTLDRLITEAECNDRVSFVELVKAAGLDPARDFIGAYLANLDFRDEDLQGFDFSHADLTGADFRRANLAGVRFDGAILTGAIGLSQTRPGFRMEQQQRSNWAWCAVAVSVAKYYDPTVALTQCELANLVLGRSDCCQFDGSPECDRPASLADALRATGNFISSSIGSPTGQEILSRISNGDVIPCLIEYLQSSVTHAVVIIDAYRANEQGDIFVRIADSDPILGGELTMLYDQKTYHNTPVRWAHTYRVGRRTVPPHKTNRTSEAEMCIGALRIAASLPDGKATTTQIKEKMSKFIDLTEGDLARSKTRPNEFMYHQIIGNIISHQTSKSNIFVRGLAIRTKDGIQITDAGREFLRRRGV